MRGMGWQSDCRWRGVIERSRQGPAWAIQPRFLRVRSRRERATLKTCDPRSSIHDPGGSEIRARWGGAGHDGDDAVMSLLPSR